MDTTNSNAELESLQKQYSDIQRQINELRKNASAFNNPNPGWKLTQLQNESGKILKRIQQIQQMRSAEVSQAYQNSRSGVDEQRAEQLAEKKRRAAEAQNRAQGQRVQDARITLEQQRAEQAADRERRRLDALASQTKAQASSEKYSAGMNKQAAQQAQQKENSSAEQKEAVQSMPRSMAGMPTDAWEKWKRQMEGPKSKAGMPSDVEARMNGQQSSTEETEAPEENKKEKKSWFSKDFYADLSGVFGPIKAALQGVMNKGHDITYGNRVNKENLHLGMSQQHQKAGQDERQVANANARDEAAKDAMSQAAADSAQNVNNLGASAGAAQAAAERVKGTGDVQSWYNRKDQARQQAVENEEKRYDDLQAANETNALGKAADFKLRQRNMNNAMSDYLSGGDAGNINLSFGKKTVEQTEPDTPPPEEEQVEAEPGEPALANGQRVVNNILGSSYGQELDDNDQALLNQIMEQYNVRPVPLDQAQSYYPPNVYAQAKNYEGYYISRDDEYGSATNKKAALQALRQIRGEGDASKNLDEGYGNEQSGYTTVPSSIISGVTSDRI